MLSILYIRYIPYTLYTLKIIYAVYKPFVPYSIHIVYLLYMYYLYPIWAEHGTKLGHQEPHTLVRTVRVAKGMRNLSFCFLVPLIPPLPPLAVLWCFALETTTLVLGVSWKHPGNILGAS